MAKTEYTHAQKILHSTSIDMVYYDVRDKRLYIKFHNGAVAGYKDVSLKTFVEMAGASSVGKYYNQHIRGAYPGVSAGDEFVKRVPITPGSVMVDGSGGGEANAGWGAGGGVTVIRKIPTRQEVSGQPTLTVVSQPAKRSYVVRGYTLTEESYEVSSVEEAVALFKDDFGSDARVKEVVIPVE